MDAKKHLLRRDRIRHLPKEGWSWIDRRFVREKARDLDRDSILLYFFLAAVGDKHGLSFAQFALRWVFAPQLVLQFIMALPAQLGQIAPPPAFGLLAQIGLLLSAFGIIYEAVADAQLARFKADPANKDKVMDQGVWRTSRHPNYFFEALIWWGFFLAALGSPWGWITIICPLLMLWFLLKVTGIPLTEKHSLEKRGEAYREYQRTTSAFIPWFPKKLS